VRRGEGLRADAVRVLAGLLAAVLSACTAAGSDAGPGTPTVVENEAPALGGERAWKVDSVPVLTVGAGDRRAEAGDTLYEFNDINGAKLLADGRIVVAVMGSHVLRFFDKSGTFVGSAGRKGDGPGEFRQILELFRIRGDTLVVADHDYDLETFAPDGKYVDDRRSRRAREAQVRSAVALDDGTLYAVEFSHLEPEGALRRRMLRLMRLDSRSGELDSIGTFPGILHTKRVPGRPDRNVGFMPTAVFGALGDSLVTGNSSRYELELRSRDGKLLRTIRRAWDAPPVTDDLKARFRDHYLNRPGEGGRPFSDSWKRQQQPFLDSDPFPPTLPAFLGVIVSRERDVWVQQYDVQSLFRQTWSIGTQSLDVPSNWDVFSSDGRWLTTVELPARFTLLDVAGDRLLGLVQNEDEEQGIRVLRLVKP
jgi:hypothetical protein